MQKIIATPFASLLAALSLVACSGEPAPAKTASTVAVKPAVAAASWAGDYHGILPCDSCAGISTLLSLNADGSYELSQHREVAGEKTKLSTGKIIWQGEIAQIGTSFYKLEQRNLYLLDAAKKPLASNYKLVKTELQQQIDANVGYDLKQFVGASGARLDVVFNTNKKPATASFNLNGEMYELPQLEAWAGGGRYANDSISVKFQRDSAELEQAGKLSSFSAQ